jgi:hypothetical protein
MTSPNALQSIIRGKDDIWYGVVLPFQEGKPVGKEVASSDAYRQICRMRFKI